MLRSLTSILLSSLLSLSVVFSFIHYASDTTYNEVRQATVLVEVPGGVCSGVAISRVHVLTAAHCAAPIMKVNGRPAFIVKKNAKADLLLLVTTIDGPFLKVAKERPSVDTRVAMAGFPLGLTQAVTEGRLQGAIRTLQGVSAEDMAHYMVVTAQGVFGNSGGPVVVRRGMSYEVVGIVSAAPLVGFGSPVYHLMLVVDTDTINAFLQL